ncbi:MAG: hypothetical protein HY913_04430 [Desulfomonile tiedjei]|nr:hypothetical protein [Desulfomonile tiedjei]
MKLTKANALKRLYPGERLKYNDIVFEIKPLPFSDALQILDTLAEIATLASENKLSDVVKLARDDVIRVLDNCVSVPDIDEELSAGELPLPLLPRLLKIALEHSLGLGEWRALGQELGEKLGIKLLAQG